MKRLIPTASQYPEHEIGEYSYGRIKVLGIGKLKIGKYCSMADGTLFLLGMEHRPDWITTYPFNELFSWARHIAGHPMSKGHVIIGNDVWIGQQSIILSGISIGNGAVIGAGSIVTKSIPAYAIAAGNPARVTSYRFDEKTRARIEAMKWWDWPIHKIAENIEHLMTPPK